MSYTGIRMILACALCCLILLPGELRAGHVISQEALHEKLVEASDQRADNLLEVNRFLNSPAAQQVFKSLGKDPEEAVRAIPQLDDQELERLASRARAANNDFAAGHMSEHQLVTILVIVLLVVAILVVISKT